VRRCIHIHNLLLGAEGEEGQEIPDHVVCKEDVD